jgi:prophage regulatory protein
MLQTILRLPAVLRKRGRSRSAHYIDIQQGLFTRPVSIGARAVGWPEHEVAALNAARIAGKSDDQIRVMVAQLEAARKTLPLRLSQGSVDPPTSASAPSHVGARDAAEPAPVKLQEQTIAPASQGG